MKLAIIGTHSTGKTTLGKLLAQRLLELGKKVIYLPELSRMCPMPINEETTIEAQYWIQEEQVRQEHVLNTPEQILICDRATLDNYAYLKRASEQRPVCLLDWYEKRAAEHMRTYDSIFKTRRLPLPAVVDGVRSTDDVFREDIDQRIQRLLLQYAIPHVLLDETVNYAAHIERMIAEIKDGHLTRPSRF